VSISAAVAPGVGRGAVAEKEAVRRRSAVQRVREARDRLTSTSGTTPEFDAELLRLFAQNRLSGSLFIIMLVCSIGLLSGVWTGPVMAGTWTAAVLLIHLIILLTCRKFLAEAPGPQQIRACASSCSTCSSASPGCST
jgi:two-component system cell cycle sensor histidine kinase PleC